MYIRRVMRMTPGEVIENVSGLTRDKLTYFVRAGYVNPQRKKKGSLSYNDFSEKDFFLVKRAWEYIKKYDMRTKSAFERAEREYDDPQLSLLE
jgi:DNA-binding transcriptional MerR regulator